MRLAERLQVGRITQAIDVASMRDDVVHLVSHHMQPSLQACDTPGVVHQVGVPDTAPGAAIAALPGLSLRLLPSVNDTQP
jgi:hypothetical protein